VYIYDKDETESLDNVTSYMLEYTKDYTLIDYGIKSNDGVDYVEFIYKDDKQTYQDRYYLSDTKEYNLMLITLNDDSYLDDKYQNIIDSFQFTFDNDGSIEDLSDVSKDGYRKYQDTRLKWSINMHPDWEEYKNDKIQNKVSFNGKNDAHFSVEVYSLENGETLDSITKESIKEAVEALNPKLYTLEKQESSVIGGVKCSKLYYSYKISNNITYGCEVLFIDKNYKYILSSQLLDKDYNDVKQKELVDGIINSFNFKELETKKIGKLLDPNKIDLSKKTQKIYNDLYSIDIPFNWKEDSETMKSIEVYSNG
jgi:hypothetical protein